MDIDILTTEELKQMQRDIDTRMAKMAVEKRIEEQRKLIGCYFLLNCSEGITLVKAESLTDAGRLYCTVVCWDHADNYIGVEVGRIYRIDEQHQQIDENEWNVRVREVFDKAKHMVIGGK